MNEMKMKTKATKAMWMMMLGGSFLFASCLSEDHDFSELQQPDAGKAKFMLDLNVSAEFGTETRAALDEAAYKNTANYTVQVISAKTSQTVLQCLGSELSTNLPKEVDAGSYTIRAFYGAEPASGVSQESFLVTGESSLTLKAKDEKPVTVNCAPTCGKVSVSFDSDMATYYSNYSVDFSGPTALNGQKFTWTKDETAPYYVTLAQNGETVAYAISLSVKDDYAHMDDNGNKLEPQVLLVQNSFNLQRNKAVKLTVKPNYTPATPETEGQLSITITIDESTNDKEVTFEVPIDWI